jgi:hypothetical protein
MTNNSMKSRQAYLGKFVQLGVPAAVVRRGTGHMQGRTRHCQRLCHPGSPARGVMLLHRQRVLELISTVQEEGADKCVLLLLPQEEIYCSSYSAAAYLDSIGFDRSKKVC